MNDDYWPSPPLTARSASTNRAWTHPNIRRCESVIRCGVCVPQLFQHSDELEDAWRAYELAREATERGEGRARWLTAAAYDRWLMYQSKPQKYRTQYVHDSVRHRLWDVDTTTTDAERAAWDVPPLAEQLHKAEEATRIDPPQPINLDDTPWWLKQALLLWKRNAGASDG